MDTNAIPTRLAVRLAHSDRQALATITRALAMQHRPAPSVSDAVKTALSLAAEIMTAREASSAAAE